MREKSLIVSLALRNGRLAGGSTAAEEFAPFFRDLRDIFAAYFTCADGYLVEIEDEEDGPRECSLDVLREFCAASAVPVIGYGNLKRLEDVKKLIYAGCALAALDPEKPSNEEMRGEAEKRFGKDHITSVRKNAEGAPDLAENSLFANPETADLCKWSPGELSRYRETLGKEGEYLLPDRSAAFAWQEFKLGADGLLPVVVQEEATDQVLMVAYMNEEAYRTTVTTGRMTYYSRSRKALWVKGETSGHYQYVRSLKADCDMDTLLARVVQIGPACHTGSHSCFFRDDYTAATAGAGVRPEEVLRRDFETILERREAPVSGSYTNYLFDKGLDKMLKKLGEEASEIIIAAKNPGPTETVYEIADFLYHMMVVMAEKGISWEDITSELVRRQKTD